MSLGEGSNENHLGQLDCPESGSRRVCCRCIVRNGCKGCCTSDLLMSLGEGSNENHLGQLDCPERQSQGVLPV